MNSFLQNLVTRSLYPTVTLRPRIASRMEEAPLVRTERVETQGETVGLEESETYVDAAPPRPGRTAPRPRSRERPSVAVDSERPVEPLLETPVLPRSTRRTPPPPHDPPAERYEETAATRSPVPGPVVPAVGRSLSPVDNPEPSIAFPRDAGARTAPVPHPPELMAIRDAVVPSSVERSVHQVQAPPAEAAVRVEKSVVQLVERTIERERVVKDAPPREPARPEARPRAGVLTAPRVQSVHSQIGALPEATPTIHVTIGRIEVRAAPAAAAPRKQKDSTPASSPNSLESYLRRRSHGSER